MSKTKKLQLQSLAVHAGRDRTAIPHTPPIDLSTTTRIHDLPEAIESITAINQGQVASGNPIYSRLHNDTIAGFENALATLEQAQAAVAFASGMAAITAVLMEANQRGDHIVACRPIYGGTDSLLQSGLLGLDVTWTSPHQVGQAITPRTSLVMIETPANPSLKLIDIAAVRSQIGDLPLSVDSTFATPVLQQPILHGADIVIHSATKFIGGHSDVLAGVVACSEAYAQKLRRIRIATGGNLHPLSGYLLHRGLQTMPLRVHAAQKNATFLAQKLRSHKCISKVYHPSLPSCDPEQLVGKQMVGPGALLAFDCLDGFATAQKVMNRIELITPAVSLGSVDSLLQHPAGLTHINAGAKSRSEAGITDGMLRMSVGIEDQDDLWADLLQALSG